MLSQRVALARPEIVDLENENVANSWWKMAQTKKRQSDAPSQNAITAPDKETSRKGEENSQKSRFFYRYGALPEDRT